MAWEHIIKHDTKLAEVVDGKFNDIENGMETGRVRSGKRFVTLRVPGRDDLYIIVWENRDAGPYVVHVGRIQG